MAWEFRSNGEVRAAFQQEFRYGKSCIVKLAYRMEDCGLPAYTGFIH